LRSPRGPGRRSPRGPPWPGRESRRIGPPLCPPPVCPPPVCGAGAVGAVVVVVVGSPLPAAAFGVFLP
jgi:hypothetical protein